MDRKEDSMVQVQAPHAIFNEHTREIKVKRMPWHASALQAHLNLSKKVQIKTMSLHLPRKKVQRLFKGMVCVLIGQSLADAHCSEHPELALSHKDHHSVFMVQAPDFVPLPLPNLKDLHLTTLGRQISHFPLMAKAPPMAAAIALQGQKAVSILWLAKISVLSKSQKAVKMNRTQKWRTLSRRNDPPSRIQIAALLAREVMKSPKQIRTTNSVSKTMLLRDTRGVSHKSQPHTGMLAT